MSRTRANGTGSVYKRGATWTAQIVIDYRPTGAPIYKRKGGFKTKTEALKALPTLKDVASRTPTISYYYDAFLAGKGDKLSKSKLTAYRIAFGRLKPLAHKPIDQITVVDLQACVSEQAESYYPARDMKVLLNHIYKLAAADGNANPALPGLIELPKLEETAREPFTKEEQAALWRSYEEGNEDASIPLIMIYTGMMTGELRDLTCESIDLERKEIVGAGKKTEVRKKTSVLLPDAIIPVIEAIITSCGYSGKLYKGNEDAFYARYYAALERAGVRRLTPYSCRHTTATALAIDENIAPQTVRRVLRWASTRMMDRYVHPDDSDAREAINRL